MLKSLEQFRGLNCTINTTEDCNLRCKYCYETCKTTRKIDIEKCYKFVDLILSTDNFLGLEDDTDMWLYDGRVFDFIGGDSLMNVDILDKIMNYINTKVNIREVPLKEGWRASISSNGCLFENPQVRAFCEKWKENLHLGVSIDGCPEIHDKNRVFPNGTGSMATILKWWPWYKKYFPREATQTKATCSKDSIPFLYDSLIWLHETLGLKYINQNFIMEDMHLNEDDIKELDRQLELCAKYVLDHSDEMYWSMIDTNFLPEASPVDFDDPEDSFYKNGRCGSGRMPTCAIDGKIYPCFRWLAHTQNGKDDVMCVGNVDEGFTHIENFVAVQKGSIRANCTKEEKCRTCEYEPCCSYCIGGCYAEYGDFTRTTHICEVIKLQCKWARWYWKEYCKKTNTDYDEFIKNVSITIKREEELGYER